MGGKTGGMKRPSDFASMIDVRDLVGLLGDQSAPDRVALGPEVLALVVEALALLVDDDAERHAIDTGHDARRRTWAPVHRSRRVALGGVADRLGMPLADQLAQHEALVVRGAADQEVVGRLAPDLAEPFEIRFEPAGCGHEGLRGDLALDATLLDGCRYEAAVAHVEVDDLAVVCDPDAQTLGGVVVRIDQRLASAEEEGVGPRDVQRAGHCGLESHTVPRHPSPAIRGGADDDAGQLLVGLATRDLDQVAPVLVLGIGTDRERPRGRRACSAGCGCAGCCRRGTRAARTRARAHFGLPRAQSGRHTARHCHRRPRARRGSGPAPACAIRCTGGGTVRSLGSTGQRTCAPRPPQPR